MQGAGADAPVVGDQSALFAEVFDAAEQVLIDRMWFVNDRGTAVLFAVDEYVGQILFTQNQPSGANIRMFLSAGRHQEVADCAA